MSIRQDLIRLNLNISRQLNHTLEENAERHGFKDKSSYIRALINEDDRRWHNSNPKKVVKEAIAYLQDDMARISATLGIKARVLAIITSKMLFDRMKSETSMTDFKDYLQSKDYEAEIVDEAGKKSLFCFPKKPTQIAYLKTELQKWLIARGSVVLLNDRPLGFTSEDLTLYAEWLRLRFKAREPLETPEILTETENIVDSSNE